MRYAAKEQNLAYPDNSSDSPSLLTPRLTTDTFHFATNIQSPNVKLSNPVSKRTLVPEALLSPTIDFPKRKSIGGPLSGSNNAFATTPVAGCKLALLSEEPQENMECEEDDDVAEKSKEDPLAAQVWRLYSRAKDSLPNAQRLENLTWRMMAMTLHKKGEGKQSNIDPSPPSLRDTVSEWNPQNSHDSSSASENPKRYPTGFTSTNQPRSSRQSTDGSFPITKQLTSSTNHHLAHPQGDNASRQPTSSALLTAQSSSTYIKSAKCGTNPSQTSDVLLGGPSHHAEVEQKSPVDPFGSVETLSSPGPLAGAIDATAAYSSASQQQLSRSIADLIALESVIQSLEENNASFDITDGSLGSPVDHYLGPASPFAQLHGFINSPNQLTPIPITPPYMNGQFHNAPAQASTVGQTPGVVAPFIYPFEQSSQQLHHSFGWTATSSNGRDFSGPGPMDIQSDDHCNDIQSADSPASTSSQEKQSSHSMSPEVQSSQTEEGSTAPAPPTQCSNCETRTTPLWRRDEEGNSLCNACGLFLKLHGRVRPRSLKTDVIRKRNRGGINSKSTKRTQEKIREEEEEDQVNDHPVKKGEDHHHGHRRTSAASQQSRDSVAEFAYTGECNQYPNATPTADVATARRESILSHFDTRNTFPSSPSDLAHSGPANSDSHLPQTSPKRRRRLSVDMSDCAPQEPQSKKDSHRSRRSMTQSTPSSPRLSAFTPLTPASMSIQELALLPEFQQILQEQQLRHSQQQQQQQYQFMLYLAQHQQRLLQQQIDQYMASGITPLPQIPLQQPMQQFFPQVPIMTTTNMCNKVAIPSFDPLAAAAATMALFGQDEWSSLATHFPNESQESDMLSEEQQQRAVAMLLDEFRAKLAGHR
ncbi:hypothetical protein BGZ80_001210 [Entomortierella chlamydospora]|uniref:GATA-type domain-containing protein n=1 Tax=Entomortierella chlamydospora TaxID=101097 RepID=A0A9P6MRD7_9FUNG|nr:hypothetical protein BGZ79_009748 [Entomortierella chlamydospora]KAG0010758.1 hypothetical protein BGZ80_001210 [Entomortierella chlamydospora]